MDDLQTETEQLEEMRQWWSENGRYVIGGIVIGAGLLFGWNNYQSNKLVAQSDASALFESLASHVDDGDIDDAALVADQMALDFADTSYTAQSKLAMARLYMDLNRDQDAADVLRQLLAMSGHDELKNVGRLRLAKIMLYQDRPQEVVELLDGEGGTAFAAQYAEVTGDAHAAMGDFAAAGQAYQSVLADAEQGSVDRNIVQMKLIDLPDVTVTQAVAPAPEVPVDDASDAAAADPEAEAESDSSAEAEDAE